MKHTVICAILSCFLAAFLYTGYHAAAQEHYDVYNYDRWGEAVPSQAGYIASRAVSGRDLGIGPLSEPRDIFRAADDRIFIADTGNDRIAVTDPELTKAKIMDTFTFADGSETTLSQPEGICLSPETGLMYIADTGNARVLVCDEDGNAVLEITRPDTEMFSQEQTFLPRKVLADKAGNIYAVLDNITKGAVMFDSEGVFQGYYGANSVEKTSAVIADHFWKMTGTDEMRSKTVRTVPSGITSFDLDKEGFFYTCSQSVTQKTDRVKKLDPAGRNLFSGSDAVWGDYGSVYDTNTNRNYQSMICDIDVADDGCINCLDYTSGRVFQYDEDGNLLFIIGSISDQLGGFKEVSALESSGQTILVTDARKNTVTIFEETDFGRIVHEATALYNDGCYEQAMELWYEALRYDGSYRRAFQGISAALLVQEDYEGAMKYAKLADSSYQYNRGFEGWRSEFLAAHMTDITWLLIVCIAGAAALRMFYRKRKKAAKPEREA